MTVAAILGLGARGQVWAEALVRGGWTVRLFDPIPGLADSTAEGLRHIAPGAPPQAMGTISASVEGADWIADCTPDRALLKQKLFQLVQHHADPGAILASAATTLETEPLRDVAPFPDQVLIARLDGHRVRLIAAPCVGAGLLAYADRLLRQAGLVTVQDIENPPVARNVVARPRVIRLGLPQATRPAPASLRRRPATPPGQTPRR